MTNMSITELNNATAKLKEDFEQAYTKWEKDIPLVHKILKECLSNQVDLQLCFEKLMGRASYLEKLGEDLKEQWHGHAYTTIMAKSQRVMSSTDAKKFADCETQYIQATKAYNQAYKTRKEIEAVLNTITARKYLLHDQCEVIKAGASSHIL